MTLGVDNLSEALGSDVVEPKRRLGQGAELSSRCGGEVDTGNGESRHRGAYLTNPYLHMSSSLLSFPFHFP